LITAGAAGCCGALAAEESDLVLAVATPPAAAVLDAVGSSSGAGVSPPPVAEDAVDASGAEDVCPWRWWWWWCSLGARLAGSDCDVEGRRCCGYTDDFSSSSVGCVVKSLYELSDVFGHFQGKRRSVMQQKIIASDQTSTSCASYFFWVKTSGAR
jgi:hypothetical protein